MKTQCLGRMKALLSMLLVLLIVQPSFGQVTIDSSRSFDFTMDSKI